MRAGQQPKETPNANRHVMLAPDKPRATPNPSTHFVRAIRFSRRSTVVGRTARGLSVEITEYMKCSSCSIHRSTQYASVQSVQPRYSRQRFPPKARMAIHVGQQEQGRSRLCKRYRLRTKPACCPPRLVAETKRMIDSPEPSRLVPPS